MRDEYAALKLYNAVVALKEFIAALDHTKFDVFIGAPEPLKRLQDARYRADVVIVMMEAPSAPPLLSAAADMLTALKDCCAALDGIKANPDAIPASAISAIAKAEGR